METINKNKIASMLKSKLGLSGVLCEEIVNQVIHCINYLTITEQKLMLKNFGSFYINNKNARCGINLQTKEKVTIAPRKVMRFIPAKQLKTLINNGK